MIWLNNFDTDVNYMIYKNILKRCYNYELFLRAQRDFSILQNATFIVCQAYEWWGSKYAIIVLKRKASINSESDSSFQLLSVLKGLLILYIWACYFFKWNYAFQYLCFVYHKTISRRDSGFKTLVVSYDFK